MVTKVCWQRPWFTLPKACTMTGASGRASSLKPVDGDKGCEQMSNIEEDLQLSDSSFEADDMHLTTATENKAF